MNPFRVARDRPSPPFDPTDTLRDIDGNEVRFMNSPLDEDYLEEPGAMILPGMLPPEEIEVVDLVISYKVALAERTKLGLLGAIANIFGGSRARSAQARVRANETALREVVAKSRAHRAALHRIVKVMPAGCGGREALHQFFDL